MSGWNALAALAAGGEAYLAHKETTRKEKLQAQLEKDRIAGEVQRDIDKENRAAARKAKEVAHTALEEQSPGNWVAKDYNADNGVLSERPARPDEIITWNEGLNKSRATEIGLKKAEKEYGYMDEDHSLDRRFKEAGIAARNRSNTGGSDDEDDVPPVQPVGSVVQDVWDSSKELIEEYTGDKENPNRISVNDARMLAEDVVKTVQKVPQGQRGDYRETFRLALQNYAIRQMKHREEEAAKKKKPVLPKAAVAPYGHK